MSLLSGALRLSASGPLPVDEVWERYTQPACWPRWAPHLREVEYREPVVTPGTTGRVTGVGGVVTAFRIDAVDEEARTWAWSVRTGPLRLSFEHGVDVAASGLGAGERSVARRARPVAGRARLRAARPLLARPTRQPTDS